jgi:hypothetical protein
VTISCPDCGHGTAVACAGIGVVVQESYPDAPPVEDTGWLVDRRRAVMGVSRRPR